MDRKVQVRCHELAPVIGDRDGNLRVIDDAVQDAMAAGCQLLVLPELATSGYHLTAEEARAAALPASSPVLERWARLLRPDAVLVVGFAEASDDGIYNSAAVLAGHGVFAVYRKTHLRDAEKDVFTPGQVAAGVLETPVGPLGTLLCYDLEFPEMPRRLALMALLGVYVGVIPIALGLLWMPFVRRSSLAWVQGMLAFTIGLLAYLAFDAALEGTELVADSGAFGGNLVVIIGALFAYITLEGVEGFVHRKRTASQGKGAGLSPQHLALLISIGIGLHNLGEGLAIGAAYAAGSLALGAFLVIGFAIHNTTEGLAIVAPLAGENTSLGRLATLGLIAGSPAILGALVGATVQQPTLVAFLFGVGAGAVGQVALKLLPLLKSSTGRILTPLTAGGVILGVAFMFATGLLVAT